MRRFEYQDEKSAKFWEVEQREAELDIRWGRIGSAGQSQTKAFADAAKASAAMVKLVNEKTGKGYVEAGAVAGASTTPGPAKSVNVSKLPAEQPSTPPESVDQQIERAFEAMRAQIADGTLAAGTELTSARIKRAHGIGELAAGQVHKQLANAGLISPWQSTIVSEAKRWAAEMAEQRDAGAAAPAPAAQSASGQAPWLAQGEPLRLGDAGDSTRRLARATRRHPQPVTHIDAQRAWLQVRTHIAAGIDPDFAGCDPALRAPFEAAWHARDSRRMPETTEQDALLLALCLHGSRRWGQTCDVVFIDYLVARHGLPGTIEILLGALAYAVQEEVVYAVNRQNPVRIGYRTAAPQQYRYRALREGEWNLRAHLACAPPAIHDDCAARARAGMSGLVAEDQVALALLFPDLPDLTHALIGQLCAEGGKLPPAAHWLQLTARDPAALAQARKAKADNYSSLWNEVDLVSTILLEHRTDAVRWLAPGAAEEAAGDALARIGTPEALEALARAAATSKNALTRFHLAVERWPVAATAALARLLGTGSREADLLMPTLVELVRRLPCLPQELQPWLEPAAHGVLTALQARLAGPTELASAEDLPEVLADVPWLRPRQKAAQVLQLAALPLAPVERWDDGEREEILATHAWRKERYASAFGSPEGIAGQLGFHAYRPSPEQQAHKRAACAAIAHGRTADLIVAWRAMLAEKKKERWFYYTFDGAAATCLPTEMGLALWNVAATEASCSDADLVAASWGLAAFPGIFARIGSAPSENLATALHFGVVELGPIAARAFARLKTLRALGRAWLQRFPEHAACALIAPAVGKPGEARDCAASALRYLASIGHAGLLDEVAGRYGKPEVLAALHAVLAESPLDRFPNKRAALPGFWKPGGWSRPLLHNGKALPDAALDVLGTMMGFPTTEEVYAGLHQVKAACTAQSLADFAWDCFSAWLNASAPSKEAWALTGLGILGNDETARKLTPFIRAWPGEAAHARAVAGLDVLAAIGSDVALMLLNGIAQKVKFKGLQDKAREKIEALAEARGLSTEELEDRLAPDLGLDDDGTMVLDFGPRAFKVGFDEALKPYVREWQDGRAGARLPDLPKPKKTDDAELAQEAVERFKLLKKDARTIASQQVLRLELAMCARRRWSPEVFAQFLARHPLVRHLVRRLVWGVYRMPLETAGDSEDGVSQVASYGGTLLDCFRVSEEGEYTTAGDDPFVLPEGEQIRIGLPHALELPAHEAAQFGQLLADYELLQPFAQLGRDTYLLTEAERGADKLLRWKDAKIPTGKILGLSNIGWRRGPAQDSGCIWTYDKTVDAGRVLELAFEPGILVGMVDENPEQVLGEITLEGHGRRGGANAKPASFGTLDAIAASELIRDMERLRS